TPNPAARHRPRRPSRARGATWRTVPIALAPRSPVIRVRPFAPPDVAALLQLLGEQLAHEGLPPHSPAQRERLAAAALASPPRFEVLLAELDGRVIGCALFLPGYSTFKAEPGLFLVDLVVLPEARGAGVGTALLRACARTCLERGWGYLEWQVSSHN